MIARNNKKKDKMKSRKLLTGKTFGTEQMLSSIIEHSNEIFYIHCENHKLIYVSPQSLQILGYTPDEMMTEWTRLVTDNPMNKMGYESTMKALVTGKRQNPYLLEVFKKDGKKVLLEIEESPLKDEKGKVIGIIGAARDVTERKKAEEMLQASEERFRDLTENTSDWIWEVDQSLIYTYSSPKVKDLLGYEPHEVIGKKPFDLMPKDEARHISEISHSLLSSRKPFTTLENINLHKDGRQVIIETSGVPIFDTNGNFCGYRGIDRDITERRRTEEFLKDQELQLRTLSDNVPNGLVYQIDSGEDGQQRRFTFISSGIEKMHGITTAEALNDARAIYNQVIEEDRIRLAAEEALAAATMAPISTEVRLRLPSGELRWRFFTSAPRRFQNNHLVWDGIEIDITERKKTEDILKEKERELEIKAKNLEEMNTALKVLLKKRDEDRVEVEGKVLLNIKELVLPYFDKIKNGGLDQSQMVYADILESHLKDIVSSFSYRLSSNYLNLTPSEIKVANLVKQGKTNKEIADLLNISERTAAFHRERIRQKLGLKNQKTNLRSYLSSIK